MNLTVFKFEFKKNLKSVLIWAVAWSLMALLTFLLYEEVAKSQEDIEKLLDSFPEELLKAFATDKDSFAKISGYFSSQVLSLEILATSIYGVFLASGSLGKEISNKSLTFLLSRPISRVSIFMSKFFAVASLIFVFNLLFFATSSLWVILTTNEEIPWAYMIYALLGTYVFEMFFVSLGFLLSLLVGDGKSIAVGSAVAIFALVIDGLSGLDPVPDFVKYLTPNYYLNLNYVTSNEKLFLPEFFVLVVASLLFVVVGSILFKRKDIDI